MGLFSVKYSEQLLKVPGLVEELQGFYARLSGFLLTSFNDDGTLITAPAAQISDLGLPVGAIIPYAGTSVPTGWLVCDGSAVSRATYATLYSAIGTTYGSGDGATTFNLPDLRGRFPLGKADSGTGSTLGATGGALDHTHTGPSHTHAITAAVNHTHTISADGTGATGAPSAATTVASGAGASVASSTHTHTGPSHSHGGATGSNGAHDHGGATGSGGAGSTGGSNPAYLAIRFLILVA